MSRTKIRFAEESDHKIIIRFIEDYWKKDHIFVKDPEIFCWQYKNQDGRWNIVIAENTNNNGKKFIVGILGFIPMGRYDKHLGDDCIFLAVWKVREDVCPPGVGLQMLKHINKTLSPFFIGAIGISDMVKPIYRALGYRTGKLDQLALLNPVFKSNYNIAKVPSSIPEPTGTPVQVVTFRDIKLDEFQTIEKIDKIASNNSPQKSFEYIKNRYFAHPW